MKRRNAPKTAGRRSSLATGKETNVARLTRERDEALEQLAATSEVLQVISRSPGELKPVFEAILQNALHICEAKFGTLYLYDGNAFRAVADTHHAPPAYNDARKRKPRLPPVPDGPVGRVAITKQVVHIADLRNLQSYLERYPTIVDAVELGGFRTALGVPMLRDNKLVGCINILRQEVRPFTDKQIDLIKNFAAQAVIAIENTRLLNELRESLQQQTATADVLKVISSSPGELEPVFEAMLENATRICEATFGNLLLYEGDAFRRVAMHNAPQAMVDAHQRDQIIPRHSAPVLDRLARAKEAIHIVDLAAEYPSEPIVKLAGARTLLLVPMLKEDGLIGAIGIYRQEVRPFTDKQIELVQNFAAQAVIAIENTRLLNELRQRTDDLSEALEQQTATSEVLKVISSSPGELEPVFEAMLENATRICEAKFGILFLSEGDTFRTVALYGAPPAFAEARQREPVIRAGPGISLHRAATTMQPVQIADIRAEPAYTNDPQRFAILDLAGARTMLSVPMLKDDRAVGVISIYRQEVRPFTDKQIELVENFAAQAVIAIENTRLLNELRQRTDDLSESLEQQTATSEVLKVISSSPGELEPVFDGMLANATRICEAKFGNLFLYADNSFRIAAQKNPPAAYAERWRKNPILAVSDNPRNPLTRLATTKCVVNIADLMAESGYIERDPRFVGLVEFAGARTHLLFRCLRTVSSIGAIAIYRQEVRPFTDKQIELVQNFAAQAVIAIENTRLLNELRESLQQQTATADVLKVISRSTFDLQTVLDSLVEFGDPCMRGRYGDHPAARG